MQLKSDETAKSKGGDKIFRYTALGLCAVMSVWLLLILAGRLLRPAAINQISELTGTKIIAKSVKLNFDGSVRLKNLSIIPAEKSVSPDSSQGQYDDTILKADSVYARFGFLSLLMLQPKLSELKIKNFVLNVLYDSDSDKWNLATIKFISGAGSLSIPQLELKNGLLSYTRIIAGSVQPVIEFPFDLTLDKESGWSAGYEFKLTTGARQFGGKNVLTGQWKKGELSFSGGISSQDEGFFEKIWVLERISGEASYDNKGNYTIHLIARDLKLSEGLSDKKMISDRKPASSKFEAILGLEEFLDEYRPVGNVNIELTGSGNLSNLQASKINGTLNCGDISVRDIAFPYRFDNITGRIDFTETGCKLHDLSGKHNGATFSFNGWSEGFGVNRRYEFRMACAKMPLDGDLYDALTAEEKIIWSAFSPSGTAAIDYHIIKSAQSAKKTRLEVMLSGTEARYEYFPYPLKDLTGTLLFDNGSVTLSDVISQTSQGRIIINGKILNFAGDKPDYDIAIDCNNVLLGSQLSASLPEKQKYLWEKLNLGGVIDGDIRIRSSAENAAGFAAEVTVKKGELQISAMPAKKSAIKDVSGQATITADMIHIEEFRGRYGEGTVSLHGQVWPAESAKSGRYHLSLFAEKLELNDVVLNMLTNELRPIATGLNPSGKINISGTFDKVAGSEQPDYQISADCTNSSISIKNLGCDLKDIAGTVRITNDRITLEGISANVGGKDAMADRPAIMINGEAAIKKSGVANSQMFDFKSEIEFKNCDFDSSGKITNVSGLLKIDGIYKPDTGLAKGHADFAAERLKVDNALLTNLESNFDYEPSRKSWASKSLIGDFYDGKLSGKLSLKSADIGLQYTLQANLNNIDLAKFLADAGNNRVQRSDETAVKDAAVPNHTSGKMSGTLDVTGRAGGKFPSMGRCRLMISEMRVGKMSPLAKIISVLQLSRPEDFAFDQMLLDSYIENKNLNLEKIDLSGKTLAFNGSGVIDLESQKINVSLTARGKRLWPDKPSIMQSLTDALSRAVVRIDVTGDFYDPKIENRPLPVIKDSLELLGTKAEK